MNPKWMKHLIRIEIDKLRREEIIDSNTHGNLMGLYPSTRWDYSSLGRWFLVFGTIALAAGAYILAKEIFELTLKKLAVCIALFIIACGLISWRLGISKLVWSKRSIELLGGLSIIGLTFTLGYIYSSGSGNWPALLLIDMIVLLPLTYYLRNVLLLILTVVVFFTWFGGVTGYASGWGMYWFGMNYPLRFLIVGVLMAGVSIVHRTAEQKWLQAYEGFFKVWLSAGIFFSEMSLWLMSLFGNFGDIFDYYLETGAELFLFNLLWAGFNAILLILGSRCAVPMVRGYAITFFIIQGYTLYFWKIAEHLGAVLATFIAGAATLALVVYFEAKRRQAKKH